MIDLRLGNSLDVLRTMPDNSIDAVVCDPPYELSNDGKQSAVRVFLEFAFPQNAKIESHLSGSDCLPLLVNEILGLSGVRGVPTPTTSVPVVPVTLNDDAPLGEHDVKYDPEGSIGVSEDATTSDVEAQAVKHLGCFALKLTDRTKALQALNEVGTGFVSGGIGVGFRVQSTGYPSTFHSRASIVSADQYVGSGDGSLPDLVRTLVGAASDPVFCLDLRQGAIENFSANGARLFASILLFSGAELVRADAAACRLPTMFESRRVCVVDDSANRAFTFDLIVHEQIISTTGFMGKQWDGSKIGFNVELWRECLRVLKPGGHLLAFAGTRTQHRMACAIEDAGFEIRDMIAWVYGCLSEDSEVLTEDGWMLYNNAKQKNILAYDLQNDVYQWEKPSRWNEYRVESDTAYRIQSDHTDQIVSRGHRCIVERGGVLEFVPADELTGVERVPYLQGDFSALQQGRGQLLLQAMLREGEGLAQETFSQRQGKEVPIEGASRGEKPGVEGRRDPLQAQGQVCGSGDQVRSLPGCVHEHGEEGWLCNGAPTSCCDGNRSSSDAPGVCASHQPRRDGQSHGEPDAVCEQCGSQTVRARASYKTTLATVTAVEYSGLIWCPTVSTGAFVARRNGTVFITGNSGFPKSLDVSKAIDKAAGVDREVLGVDPVRFARLKNQVNGSTSTGEQWAHGGRDVTITAPATEAAKQWEGWGTALKPALEPVTVARKPITGTVAANVLEHGTGAINIDGCRVPISSEVDFADFENNHRVTERLPKSYEGKSLGLHDGGWKQRVGEAVIPPGRWPSNLILSYNEDEFELRPGVTAEQKKELLKFLYENT